MSSRACVDWLIASLSSGALIPTDDMCSRSDTCMHRDMTKITHWNQMESSIYYFIKRATWFCTQGEERERENPIQSSGSSLSIFSIELASVHTPSSFYVSCLRCAGELIGLAPRRGGEDRVRGPLLSPFCPVRTLRMHASLMSWSMRPCRWGAAGAHGTARGPSPASFVRPSPPPPPRRPSSSSSSS